MTPEDARYWLGYITRLPFIPPFVVQQALETIAAMDTEIITAQPHPRGSWNGDSEDPHYFDVSPGTRMRRHVTEWKEV
ncbi:hypothetical protein ACKFR8_05165 [Corynebacterium axilliensis]|uniref:hypothetical protein n=1 Tax=Corynebacterium sp. YSMAA5_1_F9 TaxID=3383591 RepID=UPI0038D15FE8